MLNTDQMRPARWSATVACLVALALAGAVLLPVAGLTVWVGRSRHRDQAASQAAMKQFEARSGRTDVTVFLVDGWSDCAIVSLSGGAQGGPAIAMKKVGSRWVTGRSTEEEDVGFDSDDIGGRRDCLAVANSSGPLTNGAPG